LSEFATPHVPANPLSNTISEKIADEELGPTQATSLDLLTVVA
jgi:hypothetical protein